MICHGFALTVVFGVVNAVGFGVRNRGEFPNAHQRFHRTAVPEHGVAAAGALGWRGLRRVHAFHVCARRAKPPSFETVFGEIHLIDVENVAVGVEAAGGDEVAQCSSGGTREFKCFNAGRCFGACGVCVFCGSALDDDGLHLHAFFGESVIGEKPFVREELPQRFVARFNEFGECRLLLGEGLRFVLPGFVLRFCFEFGDALADTVALSLQIFCLLLCVFQR